MSLGRDDGAFALFRSQQAWSGAWGEKDLSFGNLLCSLKTFVFYTINQNVKKNKPHIRIK